MPRLWALGRLLCSEPGIEATCSILVPHEARLPWRFAVLLCLLLLQKVDVKPALFYVLDNRVPCQSRTCYIAQTVQNGHVGSKEYEAIATVSGLSAIVENVIQHRISGLPFLIT